MESATLHRTPQQQLQAQASEYKPQTVQDQCEALRHTSDSALRQHDGHQAQATAIESQCAQLEQDVSALDEVIHETTMLCASLEATKHKESTYTENCETQLAQVRSDLDALATRHQQFTASLASVEAVSKHVQTIMHTIAQPSSRLCQLVEEGKQVVKDRTANDYRTLAAELRRRHAHIRDRLAAVNSEAHVGLRLAGTLKDWASGSWQQYGELSKVLQSVQDLYTISAAAEHPLGGDAVVIPHVAVERLLFTDASGAPTETAENEEAQLFVESTEENETVDEAAQKVPAVPVAESFVHQCVQELQAVADACARAKAQCDERGMRCDDTSTSDAISDMTTRWTAFLEAYKAWAAQHEDNRTRRAELAAEEEALALKQVALRVAQEAAEAVRLSITHETDLNTELEAEVLNYHKAIQCAVSAAEAQRSALAELTAHHSDAQATTAACEAQYAQLQEDSVRVAQAHADVLAAHDAAMATASAEQAEIAEEISRVTSTVEPMERGVALLSVLVDQLVAATTTASTDLTHVAAATAALDALATGLGEVHSTLESIAGADNDPMVVALLESIAIAEAVQHVRDAVESTTSASTDALVADVVRGIVSTCLAEAAACAQEGQDTIQTATPRAMVTLREAYPDLSQVPDAKLQGYVVATLTGYKKMVDEKRALDAFVQDSEKEMALLERELNS